MTDDERRQRFEKALAWGGDTHTVADVVELVRRGRAQFWNNGDGNIVTEINEYPSFKAVHYWLIAGELKHCLALEHEINPWAIEQGCSVATAMGRRGWGRVAAPTGWRLAGYHFAKRLIGGH